MSEGMILRRGGGGGGAYGMIAVTYPAGSTLTITGGKASKKDFSSTQRVYYVKTAGTYTITATNGTYTTSRQVVISSLGQGVAITLSYRFYIIQNGITQNGITFTATGKAYNSNSTGTKAPTATPQSGYLQVRTAPATNRTGSLYRSSSLLGAISNYAYLNVRCKRYASNSNAYMKLGTYYGTETYATNNFLDNAPQINNTTDSDIVTIQIPLTSATFSSEDVYFAVAYSVPTSGTYGIDIYDAYLTNEVLT